MYEEMTVWINIRCRLIDPEHKKPDRKKAVLIALAIPLSETLDTLKKIEKLVSEENYVIDEVIVKSG